jgi:Glycosyl transferase family 2
MPTTPTISVILPVHNARSYLLEALESVAAQTFKDFEVVAVHGGSSDGSDEALEKAALRWAWLRVERQPRPGLSAAINCALAASRGEFIARMDADDRCRPARFSRQIETLLSNPGIDAVGTAVKTFGESAVGTWRYPLSWDAVRARVFFGSPFAHPAMMFRRSSLCFRAPLYREEVLAAEDYELWAEYLWRSRAVNLPEVMLDYRCHSGQATAVRAERQRLEVTKVWTTLLGRLGLGLDGEAEAAHAVLAGARRARSRADLVAAAAWAERLWRRNNDTTCVALTAWEHELRTRWYETCRHAAPGCRGSFRAYLRSRWRTLKPVALVRLWASRFRMERNLFR